MGDRSPRAGLLTTDGPRGDLRSKVYCWVLTILIYIDRHIVRRTFYIKTWFASFFLKNLRIWHQKACSALTYQELGEPLTYSLTHSLKKFTLKKSVCLEKDLFSQESSLLYCRMRCRISLTRTHSLSLETNTRWGRLRQIEKKMQQSNKMFVSMIYKDQLKIR